MAEPQYQGYFDYPRETMGAMASQYYRDDPKLLGIHLARYKFVSKLLAGKELVAEVGCGDAWFSRIVKETVGELHLYDFDKKFVDEAYKNEHENVYCHDVLTGKLEYGKYDAAYSLDCMEHVEVNKHDIFLMNVTASLMPNGSFIVGMPSAESQRYASLASKVGHVGCLTHEQMMDSLSKYFHNVFIFTINDEQIGLNFEKMAHYYLGVCCGVR